MLSYVIATTAANLLSPGLTWLICTDRPLVTVGIPESRSPRTPLGLLRSEHDGRPSFHGTSEQLGYLLDDEVHARRSTDGHIAGTSHQYCIVPFEFAVLDGSIVGCLLDHDLEAQHVRQECDRVVAVSKCEIRNNRWHGGASSVDVLRS